MKQYRSRRLRLVVGALVAYIGCYVLLFSDGRFILSNHGGNDWTYRWGPNGLVERYWIVRSKERLTTLGIVFWPCIVVDRLAWHRSEDAGTID